MVGIGRGRGSSRYKGRSRVHKGMQVSRLPLHTLTIRVPSFVIMMLNLTDLEGGGDMSNYLPAGFIIGVVFLFEIAHVMGGRMVVRGITKERFCDFDCINSMNIM